MNKLKTYTSPKGVLVYPRIDEPDFKFNPEGRYSTKLRLSEEVAAPLVKAIDEAIEQAVYEARNSAKPADKRKIVTKNWPYERDVDDEGEETGDVLFKFAMTHSGTSRRTGKAWERTLPLFDASGCRIPPGSVNVWGGTVAKVAFQMAPYGNVSIGASVSLRMEAVQIIDLVSGGSGGTADSFGFGEEDGYAFTAEETKPAADTSEEDFDGLDF